MTRITGGLAVLATCVLAWCPTVSGEVFVLHTGGQITGELLNPDQTPREHYQIKTPSGGQIVLARSQVKEVIRRRPEELEYEKIFPRYPDTIEGQWALAEWCRERLLLSEREKHLKRILELDPDHEDARHALGYSKVDGQWMTREEAMTRQGYRYYQGRWRLPQEIELLEKKRKNELAEKEWIKKVSTWQGWLDTERSRTARENILAIDDPMAVKALAKALQEDRRDVARILYIKALARIGTPAAMRVLAEWTLVDPIEEVSLTCLDYLKEKKDPAIVEYFISKLTPKNSDNATINRAAVALRHLGDPSAIGPLIDALVTPHKFKINTGSGNQMSTTFSNAGGGGLSMGGGPKIVTRHLSNRAVLEALVELTGGVNYGFNVRTWKAWYTAQKKRTNVNTRRD